MNVVEKAVVCMGKPFKYGGIRMVPKRVSPYFDKMEVDNTLVKGRIVCCDSQDFDVHIFGELQKCFLDYVYA